MNHLSSAAVLGLTIFLLSLGTAHAANSRICADTDPGDRAHWLQPSADELARFADDGKTRPIPPEDALYSEKETRFPPGNQASSGIRSVPWLLNSVRSFVEHHDRTHNSPFLPDRDGH
ncbi:MAG: hypothetical protein HW380_1938 [Magnetococcales bacterium]|nr:hypothetical protein [Magnetococcales bacterium]HIJ84009.1 hypothetical protein [Magnetococcales bacterium]